MGGGGGRGGLGRGVCGPAKYNDPYEESQLNRDSDVRPFRCCQCFHLQPLAAVLSTSFRKSFFA